MRPIRLAACVLLFFSSLQVLAENGEKLTDRPSSAGSRDVKIPKSLVHTLETQYREFLNGGQRDDKTNLKRSLMNMSSEFRQKRNAALFDDARVVTPLGGGIVDLNEIVSPVRGSFKMKIVAQKERGGTPSGLRYFFVSQAKQRKVEGEEFGAGCGKYMEITGFMNKKGSEFDLYTAGQRYLSVVGGTFIAVGFEKDAMHVGTLTFTDSRYPELLCE